MALANTWTLSREWRHQPVEPPFLRFVIFKDTNISLFTASSALIFIIFSRRSASKSTTYSKFKPRISDYFHSFSCAAVPPHPAHFLPFNHPSCKLYPSMNTRAHHPLLQWRCTSHLPSHFGPSGQRRWLNRFPMPSSMRSRDGFWAVMSGESGRRRGRTRSVLISPSYLSPGSEHYEMRLEHTQKFGQYLLLFTEHQAAVNAKSRRLFPGSAQQPSRKNTELSLMVDTFSGSGYSGWSARETWWPGWMERTCKEAMEQKP